MSELNKHILLVMKWLGDKGSVSQDELIENRKAAYAAAAYAAADDAAYAAAYAAAAAEKWVDKYFERTGENKQDYLDAIEEEKVSSKKEPTQEWVDGLPPVGCECELAVVTPKIVIVVGYTLEGMVIYQNKNGLSNDVKVNNKENFRAIKTQEQKDRDEAQIKIEKALSCINDEDFTALEVSIVLSDLGFKAPEGE